MEYAAPPQVGQRFGDHGHRGDHIFQFCILECLIDPGRQRHDEVGGIVLGGTLGNMGIDQGQHARVSAQVAKDSNLISKPPVSFRFRSSYLRQFQRGLLPPWIPA